MFKWVLGNKVARRRAKARPRGQRPSYEKAKKIAQEGSVDERRELATHDDLEPELLYYFASDDAPEVRREVAENPGTPLQADVILAHDADEEVRYELARKIGRMVPNLTHEENKRLTELAIEVVEILARDDLPRVRATISEELKRATTVPKHIIQRLSRDIDEIVSAPVIEYSPLLSDEDLLGIIASGVKGRALLALARRRRLSEPVSEALASTEHTEAVRVLLENKTARIGDETLDRIAAGAEGKKEWHAAIVDRDNLPVRTILRIATFVSAALVEALMEKNKNLPPEVLDDVRKSVRRRIEAGDFAKDDDELDSAEDRARKLFEKNKLNESVLETAIDESDFAFVRHALVFMSGLPAEAVQKILNTTSAKGVTALAWKAGLSMSMAETLQQRIARIQPKSVLRATVDGAFPMTEEDIEWYVDFYL